MPGVGNVGGVSGVGSAGVAMGGVSQLGGPGPGAAPPAAPAPAPAPSTQGADMKRAYEALGITCPTSVSNMVGGFPRAPLSRLPGPRAGMADVVPQPQGMQALFAQQPGDMQQQQQQQQLVSHGVYPGCRHSV